MGIPAIRGTDRTLCGSGWRTYRLAAERWPNPQVGLIIRYSCNRALFFAKRNTKRYRNNIRHRALGPCRA